MKTVLAIAGTDPTGGAGIQTDLKTIEAYGLYGMAVITVVIAQNTTGVFDMQPVSAALVAKQIDCVFEDIRPDSVKLGMLYDTNIIRTVAERLRAYHAENIVLDPVMLSSSGSALLRPDAAKTLLDELFPLCALVTPNTHGTGCTLSSAIACGLAQGIPLADSVKRAKRYLTACIRYGLALGHGSGPLQHKVDRDK